MLKSKVNVNKIIIKNEIIKNYVKKLYNTHVYIRIHTRIYTCFFIS